MPASISELAPATDLKPDERVAGSTLGVIPDQDVAECERIKHEVLVRRSAGEFRTNDEFREALWDATAHLRTPIPDEFVAKAFEEHAHRGGNVLRIAGEWALGIAGEWALARQAEVRAPAAVSNAYVAKGPSRERRSSGSRRNGTRARPDDGPEPPLAPTCGRCGRPIIGRRADARWCSDSCKSQSCRSRRKPPAARLPDQWEAAEAALVELVRRGEADGIEALARICDALLRLEVAA